MFFKLRAYLFLSLLSISLLSCSNDEIKDSDSVVNLAYDTSCFDGFGKRWEMWANGNGAEALVAADVNCLVDGISYFLLRVRGEKLGSYSSQEIYNFTQKFFKSAEIKKTTVDDILIIKSWLVGGMDNEVSFEELNKISWFLKSSRVMLQQLTPLADKLLLKSSSQELTESQALLLKKTLSLLSKEVKTLLSDSTSYVSQEKFEKTLNHLLIDLKMEPLSSKKIKSIWNVISVSVGQAENAPLTLNPENGIVDLAFRAYYISLRFKYGVNDIGWRNMASYVHLESVVNEALSLVKFILGMQSQNIITKKSLNILFFEIFSLFNTQYNLSETVIDDAIEILFKNYFKSSDLGDPKLSKWHLSGKSLEIFIPRH